MSKIAAFVASVLILAGCSGGGAGGGPSGQLACDVQGLSVQLANPVAGQTLVPTNIGQVIVVFSGQFNAYPNWNVVVQNSFGSQLVQGAAFTPVSGQSLTHPFPSDFYYSSAVGGLASGVAYQVYVNQFNSNCNPIAIGGFSS